MHEQHDRNLEKKMGLLRRRKGWGKNKPKSRPFDVSSNCVLKNIPKWGRNGVWIAGLLIPKNQLINEIQTLKINFQENNLVENYLLLVFFLENL